MRGGSTVKAASSRSTASGAPASTAPGSGSSGGPGMRRAATARRVSSWWASRKRPGWPGGGAAADGLKAPWVVQENARPGTSDWRITRTQKAGDIDGYADRTSAQQGEKVTLFVSTVASGYQVEAYRIGYYQGLGGRLIWKS